jgi:invasion protein IalB
MIRRLIVHFACTALCWISTPSWSAELSGAWQVASRDGPTPICSFVQVGGNLNGSCVGPQATGTATGTVVGQTARWHWQWVTRNGSSSGAFDFIGTLRSDDTITGVVERGEAGSSLNFTAKRQEPQVAPPTAQGSPYKQAGTSPVEANIPGSPRNLVYSPWTKLCREANSNRVCFTGKDGRVESGMPVVAAVLIEPEGEPKKVLRVTLPLGMQLPPGTRVIVDQGQPMNAPYVICFTNGCMADYETSAELIGKLKKGQGLVVQGINSQGQAISLAVPLSDFAKAYDGPTTAPKAGQPDWADSACQRYPNLC